MTTSVSSRGRLVLPAELRRRDGIEAGQHFEVERLTHGDYRLRRREEPPANAELVDWLLACPAKDYFVPVPAAEHTGAIVLPSPS